MMKRMISMLLCCVLLLSALPGAVLAAGTPVFFTGSDPAETVEYDSLAYQTAESGDSPDAQALEPVAFTYKTMTSSQKLLDIIKDCEGFSATPYWDYSQWTIGYGTGCGRARDGSDVPSEYWGGITKEKGQQLLMAYLKNTAEAEVNSFFKRIGRQPMQQQFDAMVDFTYALGSAWMYEDSRVAAWLKNPTTEIELMRALGAWCRVDGKVGITTANRRIREALIYLYGLYLLPWGNVSSDLQVVENGNLPMFKYVIFDGNGTTLINTRTDDVNYYFEGMPYGSLLLPKWSGYTFGGWKKENGEMLLDGHTVGENQRVTAVWMELPFRDVPEDMWYSQPVAYCYKNGIMNGAFPNEFRPDAVTSRAMAVTVLYRMAGEPEVAGSSGLSDVKEKEYYARSVTWAVKNGITTGYKDGTFQPDKAVNREELVTFLYRYAEKIQKENVEADNQLSRYVDGASVSEYARSAFNWAISRGLISSASLSVNLAAPERTATRGQLAKMLTYLDNL